MSDRMILAQDAWGSVPDWVEKLIGACDAPGASQNKVAKMLGRTPGVVSQVIRKNYKGDMADFEDRVRAVLCPGQVQCPALGVMTTADCLRWRDQAPEWKSGPQMVRMSRACHDCSRFKGNGENDDAE